MAQLLRYLNMLLNETVVPVARLFEMLPTEFKIGVKIAVTASFIIIAFKILRRHSG